MGSHSRCLCHVVRPYHVDRSLGCDPERMGHLLCLEFVYVHSICCTLKDRADIISVVYGVGVGGEYPMTATAGMENAVGSGKISTKQDRLHRGRKVTSAFLMQGWGQFFNQALLLVLLLIFHHGR